VPWVSLNSIEGSGNVVPLAHTRGEGTEVIGDWSPSLMPGARLKASKQVSIPEFLGFLRRFSLRFPPSLQRTWKRGITAEPQRIAGFFVGRELTGRFGKYTNP
jgi:hypothetical protein